MLPRRHPRRFRGKPFNAPIRSTFSHPAVVSARSIINDG
jgi:hypothetical protein